jgi:hypothetical protein
MDNIELRSEKARNIIGKIPPVIVRSGISIVTAVFLILLTCSYFFPYTETISAPARIIQATKEPQRYYGVITIPISLRSRIEVDQQSMIEIEGYSRNKYGQISGHIERKDNTPTVQNGHKVIGLEVNLNHSLTTANGTRLAYYPGMEGTATIFLKKERLLNVLFAWMKR